MVDFLTAFLTTFGYTAASIGCARRAYRSEYAKVIKDPTLKTWGMDHSRAQAHRVASSEAYSWLAFWPFFGLWALISWLVTAPPKVSRIDELEAEIDTLAAEQDPVRKISDVVKQAEREQYYEEMKYGPLNTPCPCGYTLECAVHCGDGSKCHGAMERTRDAIERRAVRNVFHPETGTTVHPNAAYPEKVFMINDDGTAWAEPRKGEHDLIRALDLQRLFQPRRSVEDDACPACLVTDQINYQLLTKGGADQGYVDLADRLECTCGQHRTANLGRL